jgi:hypothetical protein
MRRFIPAVGAVVALVVIVAVGVITARSLNSSSQHPVRSTPVPSIVVPTIVAHPVHHPVHLAAAYRSFVHAMCHAIAHHDANFLETHLEDYQYNTGVYYGPFNLTEGYFGNADLFGSWLQSGSQHCVRIGPSFMSHGVVASAGWTNPSTSQYGTWALFDLDKLKGAWKINDETFDSYRRVMGSFFGIEPRSVVYQ